MVVSVPQELSSDHSAVLHLAEATGRVTEAEILEKLRWDGARPLRVLNELMQVRWRRGMGRSSCVRIREWVR